MQRDLYLGKHSKFKSSPFLISSVQSINLITKCLSQTQNKTFSVFSKRALVRFRDYLNKFKLWRKQRLGIHSFCPPVNLTLAHWLSRAFSNSQGVVSNEFSLIEIWTNIKITVMKVSLWYLICSTTKNTISNFMELFFNLNPIFKTNKLKIMSLQIPFWSLLYKINK